MTEMSEMLFSRYTFLYGHVCSCVNPSSFDRILYLTASTVKVRSYLMATIYAFYHLQAKLRKGNVLHLSVSHSVHRGVSAPMHAGIHTPLVRHPPQSDHPPPPPATAADGTRPTGMHSCLSLFLVIMCKQ